MFSFILIHMKQFDNLTMKVSQKCCNYLSWNILFPWSYLVLLNFIGFVFIIFNLLFPETQVSPVTLTYLHLFIFLEYYLEKSTTRKVHLFPNYCHKCWSHLDRMFGKYFFFKTFIFPFQSSYLFSDFITIFIVTVVCKNQILLLPVRSYGTKIAQNKFHWFMTIACKKLGSIKTFVKNKSSTWGMVFQSQNLEKNLILWQKSYISVITTIKKFDFQMVETWPFYVRTQTFY